MLIYRVTFNRMFRATALEAPVFREFGIKEGRFHCISNISKTNSRERKPNRPEVEIELEKQLKIQKKLAKNQEFVDGESNDPLEEDKHFLYIPGEGLLQELDPQNDFNNDFLQP